MKTRTYFAHRIDMLDAAGEIHASCGYNSIPKAKQRRRMSRNGAVPPRANYEEDRVPDIPLGSSHSRNENPARWLTRRGLGNPPAKERNSQRAPLGQPVGAIDVSWVCGRRQAAARPQRGSTSSRGTISRQSSGNPNPTNSPQTPT